MSRARRPTATEPEPGVARTAAPGDAAERPAPGGTPARGRRKRRGQWADDAAGPADAGRADAGQPAAAEASVDEPLDDTPSKSQRKRDMHALQALGERLLELSPDKLRRMDLPLDLLDAIQLAQRITAREGRRRQLQYVGRLMRNVDADAIRAQLEVDGQQHRIDTAIMHAAERWRDALVETPARLGEFIERYPLAAARPLDATLQAALAEVSRDQRGRRYRELFRQLRDIMAESNA